MSIVSCAGRGSGCACTTMRRGTPAAVSLDRASALASNLNPCLQGAGAAALAHTCSAGRLTPHGLLAAGISHLYKFHTHVCRARERLRSHIHAAQDACRRVAAAAASAHAAGTAAAPAAEDAGAGGWSFGSGPQRELHEAEVPAAASAVLASLESSAAAGSVLVHNNRAGFGAGPQKARHDKGPAVAVAMLAALDVAVFESAVQAPRLSLYGGRRQQQRPRQTLQRGVPWSSKPCWRSSDKQLPLRRKHAAQRKSRWAATFDTCCSRRVQHDYANISRQVSTRGMTGLTPGAVCRHSAFA